MKRGIVKEAIMKRGMQSAIRRRGIVAALVVLWLPGVFLSDASGPAPGIPPAPSADSQAAGTPQDAAPPVILLEPRLRGTHVFKGVSDATDVVSSAGADIPVGGVAWRYMTAGFFDAQGRPMPDRLCNNSSGGAPESEPERMKLKAKLTENAPHVWWFELHPMPSPIGKINFEVTWEHLYSEMQGRPVRVAGDTRRVSMPEGEATLLDFVAVDPTENAYCYRNLAAEVMGKMKEDTALANEWLSTEIWFEHRAADGQKTLRRAAFESIQGEKREFRFEPLRFPVPGVRLKDGRGVDSIMVIKGSIRARLRSDGDVDLEVSMGRAIGGAISGEPKKGGTGDGGHKTFRLRPGETVSLVLPSMGEVMPGSGYSVTTPEGPVLIENRSFYAGTQDSLIVRVQRGSPRG